VAGRLASVGFSRSCPDAVAVWLIHLILAAGRGLRRFHGDYRFDAR
jgi:hypothetical protein